MSEALGSNVPIAQAPDRASFCRKKRSPTCQIVSDRTLNPIAVEKRNWSKAALTTQPRRAIHGSPCKLRLSFCGSSEKSPLAITLMAGASTE
jgi:hypothetical protein